MVQKVTSLLDCPDFIAAHRRKATDFTRQRCLSFRNLILFLLNQPNSALQTELDQFFQTLHQSPLESQSVTAQAFSKARNKLNPSALVALNDVLQRQLDQQRLRRRWQGLRLLGVDGSMVHLPLASHQAQHFGSHSGLPVARLSTLYDLCDNQTLHGLLVPTDVDERGCAALHLDHAPDNSLIVFDRGYPAHWLFGDLRRRNQHFLMRLSTGYNQQVNDFVASGEPEATHQFSCTNWLSRKVCEQSGVDPDTVVAMRLIRVTLASGEVEVLATSLLDTEAFPADAFQQRYHRRWGIETDYRRLKQTLKLENVSGRSVTAVLQDFHAQLLLKNLAILMQLSQQPRIERQNQHRQWR
ncbi:IS4 family transposase [Halomonadaceae bacterium KBTZ08]